MCFALVLVTFIVALSHASAAPTKAQATATITPSVFSYMPVLWRGYPLLPPLDFQFRLQDFYLTADNERWGATLVITAWGGVPPYHYTVDETFGLPGPRWTFEWPTGVALVRSIQVIDAAGSKVDKPWYEPPHLSPTNGSEYDTHLLRGG